MVIGFCIMDHKLNKPHVQRFVDRFKKNSDIVVFKQKEILEQNFENWPKVDLLISFYHISLPLHKIYKYVKQYNIPCINDLFMQYSLFDRRVIYTILKTLKIKIPEHHFVNRCQAKIPKELKVYLEKRFATSFDYPETNIEEYSTHVTIDGNVLKKPFVEKPVNAEDHNIYVYLENNSVRKLFRKQGNVSSKICWNTKEIRKNGSFIYEKYYSADDNNDIKVYALGKETAYAETRKAPTKDGFVERDERGKEKRSVIKLMDYEYEYARKITTGFNQFVCGFDILRSNGVSYVMDVNGWSFVKNNRSYYDKCAEILKREIEKRTNACKCSCQRNMIQENVFEQIESNQIQNRLEVLKITRSQENNMENKKSDKVLNSSNSKITDKVNNEDETIKNEIIDKCIQNNKTDTEQQAKNDCVCHNKKLKKIVRVYRHGDRTPKQKLKVKMKATNNMFNKEVYIQENLSNIIDIFTKMNNEKLAPVIECLKMYKNQKGIKIQIKFVNDYAEIICKWGGILTHTGKYQCEELADSLNYYISDNNVEIFDDVKIYSSSEGRVYESALKFANSFGNRKFDVIKDKELLDDTFHATELIEACRKNLLIEFEKFKTPEDEEYFVKTIKNIKIDKSKEEKLENINDQMVGNASSMKVENNKEEKLENINIHSKPNSINKNQVVQEKTVLKNEQDLENRYKNNIKNDVKQYEEENMHINDNNNDKIKSEYKKVSESKAQEDTIRDRNDKTTGLSKKQISTNEIDNLIQQNTEKDTNNQIIYIKQNDTTAEQKNERQNHSNNEYKNLEINERWYKIQQKILNNNCMSYNMISEINDNLKYDFIHNNEKIKDIIGSKKIVEFYLFIRKYYRFLIENEYGVNQKEKEHTSKAISANLLSKMISKISETGAEIYFTKESRMYTLFNLLKKYNNDERLIKEFNYASYIGFNIYESNNSKRISIVFSRGFNSKDIIEGCLDCRHRAPLKDEELLCDVKLQDFIDYCSQYVAKD